MVKDKNKQRLSIDICIKSKPENVNDNNKMLIFCKVVFVEKDNFALSHIIDIADMNDEDFDGVPNEDDRCPDTAPGAKVDDKGCALNPDDEDLDGVLRRVTLESHS